jgi:hypothetical protein
MRVHQLAKELGWLSSQLIKELRRRGEFVKSASSTIEAPVVRAVRRDFAAASAGADSEETLAPDLYGYSAEPGTDESDETFSAALARIKAQPPHQATGPKAPQWRPAVSQALLDEVIAQRPDRLDLDEPRGGHFAWELKKANNRHRRWSEARLNGLAGNDATIIEWIRLSNGEQPHLAAELAQAGITPQEAGLRLGYGGRIGPRMDTLFKRFRDQRINRSEVIAAVRQWRQNNAASSQNSIPSRSQAVWT